MHGADAFLVAREWGADSFIVARGLGADVFTITTATAPRGTDIYRVLSATTITNEPHPHTLSKTRSIPLAGNCPVGAQAHRVAAMGRESPTLGPNDESSSASARAFARLPACASARAERSNFERAPAPM